MRLSLGARLAFAFGALLIGGATGADAQDRPEDFIEACVNKETGAMRMVLPDPDGDGSGTGGCQRNETVVVWNVAGPAGPQGPAGVCEEECNGGGGCTSDADCPAGEYCEDSACHAQKSNFAACTRSAECDQGCCTSSAALVSNVCTTRLVLGTLADLFCQ